MMKKLLFLGAVIFASCFGAKAQMTSISTPSIITDTLHYYFNKHYFKTGKDSLRKFPYFKSAASTNTDITHCGSKFDVPAGKSVTVTGLEAYVGRTPRTSTPNIPFHLYICNLNSAGKPILPPIDSVRVIVPKTFELTGPGLVGGNFSVSLSPTTTVMTPTVRVMNGSFAVLMRNMSTVFGDTLTLLRTASSSYTNGFEPPQHKYSDQDYGYVRHNGQFYSTRDFMITPGFGIGTDYEFIIAPRVQYEITAGHSMPANVAVTTQTAVFVDTICTRTPLTFTNMSSPFYEHRQYNLNQFYRRWAPSGAFQAQPKTQGGWSADSSITWNFEFEDLTTDPTRDTRVFLPYVNNGMITATSDRPPSTLPPSAGCYDNCEFRARLRPMSAYGRTPQYRYDEAFRVCFRFCNGDAIGIPGINGIEGLKVYPNPAVNGKSLITGLTGKTTITVYNMIGQTIKTEVTENNSVSIDLKQQPKGTYIVRIVNANNETAAVRLIHQD
jgi:hypothetical protein